MTFNNSIKDFLTGKNDYVVYDNIILSELILFLWASSRTIWYMIFGVVSYNFNYVLPESVWISFFSVISVVHFLGMYLKNTTLRITAITGYSIAWGIMAFLAAYQASTSAAFPAYSILTLTSLLIINRLYHITFK